jgi:hypothetical protein
MVGLHAAHKMAVEFDPTLHSLSLKLCLGGRPLMTPIIDKRNLLTNESELVLDPHRFKHPGMGKSVCPTGL